MSGEYEGAGRSGTFDNRFAGWLDFADLVSRGIALIDTSRSMTPSVAVRAGDDTQPHA